MKYPGIVQVGDIIANANAVQHQIPPGMAWVPARPLGYASWRHRWKAAWLVFTGRADALVWPGQ